ncbi:MAG TPA: lipopolysaccharide core heptose(I) kinase RfaP [Gammaproteobacteria bacterium]|nr:lipopolysaccharide core heptose(I) kinase RfaP [Gammaproteobacteria bacterium]
MNVQHQYIDQRFHHLFSDDQLFEQVSQFDGKVFRSLENRRTVRIEKGGERFFAKTHFGVGWMEIIKNLCQLRWPVLGAANEFRALNELQRLGIDTLTPVVYFSEGINPARRQSCIVTRALENTKSLEELFEANKVSLRLKRALIPRLAKVGREMHDNGINHRDFYLCHFLIPMEQSDPKPFLIDLHRAQVRKKTPRRWRVKDVGGLFFSGFDYNITRRDVFRFIKSYSGKTLRQTLQEDKEFWREVFQRATKLYFQDHQSLPAWVRAMEPKL